MSERKPMMSEDQITVGMLIAVIQDVLKQWHVILAVTLIAAMGTYVYSEVTYQPVYTTTTTFVASAGGTSTTTYQNLTAASNLASVFTEVINSSLFKGKVMETSGLRDFQGTIQASSIAETNLLTLRVTGSDPRDVFLMTQGIIEHHDIVTQEVLGNTILEVLQDPIVPTAPSNPLNIKNTVVKVAGAAGLVMCALLAGISFMSDKVRSRAEADNKLNCRVLGELYHEKKYKTLKESLRRKKTSILITNPVTSFVYTEAVHKLTSRISRRFHTDEKVLMVTSLMENEGKSTVAVNLALSFVRRGKKTLLIDGDLRKPACALILNQRTQTHSLVDVLEGRAELMSAVRKQRSTGLYVLTTLKGLRTATNLVSSKKMADVLHEAKENFDVIIVDTPPMSLAPDAEVLSETCDAAVMVVRQNEAKASALNDAIMILERSKAHLLGCILNNVYGAAHFTPAFTEGYGRYGRYGRYGKYGRYGYGKYGYGQQQRTAQQSEKEELS